MTSAPDGTPLATYRWLPKGTAARSTHGIYLLHGKGEYTGRYEHVAQWLTQRGWRVAGHDHRGHGRSGGKRATLTRDDDFIIDAEQQLAAYTEELGAPPLVLGHSMGALVGTHVALRGKVPLAGMILTSPAFRLELSRQARWLMHTMYRVAPNLRVRTKHISRPILTHDQAVAQAWFKDPLITRQVTARLAMFINEYGPRAIAQASQLPCRTLLLVAGDDRVVSSIGSREFTAAAAPGKLALRWYDRAWHEVLNETTEFSAPVYADMEAWLTQIQRAEAGAFA